MLDNLPTIPPAPVRVVNVCDLNLPETWEEAVYALKAWCDANDATYYAAPKEDCHEYLAIRKARREGKSCVVIEDLS